MRQRAFELLLFCGALAGISHPASGATLCVNPGGTGGCFSKIGSAVSAASNGDTIRVAAGTYNEDVVIGKPVSLVGANAGTTIINATGLSNAINVNGVDNPGLRGVLVTGFTLENANFEGILLNNISASVVYANHVIDNDKSLDINTPACPGLPAFETSESDDCGEGIHLMGTDHTTVASNVVEGNSGGILMSDETGPTQDNLISGNTVMGNPYDCGIVMASHPPATGSTPFGISHNTIVNNISSHNGTKVPGAGAGVGIFTFLPGGTVTANVIVNNTLTNNGLPGVAFHAHGPGEVLNDNMIVGNSISGNAADSQDATTPGSTGINVFGVSAITGTMIAQNLIDGEQDDIVVNTPTLVQAYLNNFQDAHFGVNNIGTGTADAAENWWGCSGGPKSTGCAAVGPAVRFIPWLTSPF